MDRHEAIAMYEKAQNMLLSEHLVCIFFKVFIWSYSKIRFDYYRLFRIRAYNLQSVIYYWHYFGGIFHKFRIL